MVLNFRQMRLRATEKSGVDRVPEPERREAEDPRADQEQGQEPGLPTRQVDVQDLQKQGPQSEPRQEEGERLAHCV